MHLNENNSSYSAPFVCAVEEYFEQYLTSESIPFFLSSLALGLLVGSTIGIGTFWLVALITMERTEIYLGTLLYSNAVIIYGVCLYALDILDSHIAHWILVVSMQLYAYDVLLLSNE